MKQVMVCGRWPTMVLEAETRPLWLWDNWERARFESMAANLKPGMTLFDVGSEQGDISCVYAQMVGGENMVLFEPHPFLWPNIKALWQANNLPDPKACAVTFLNSRASAAISQDFYDDFDGVWPVCANTGSICHTAAYRHVSKHSDVSPSTTLDDWVKRTGIKPDAITIDVEGSEMSVLEGAARTLKAHGPLVWVSVHPEMMLASYGRNEFELRVFMEKFGYLRHWLFHDHEDHWLYWVPGKGPIVK